MLVRTSRQGYRRIRWPDAGGTCSRNEGIVTETPNPPKEEDLDQILADPKTGNPTGRLKELRTRLASISWFMRCLNEFIARKANREDGCTGRFWEGRFKCTELLDQAAILACMTYIDLNPIRAGVSQTPEGSDYTSGQDRYKSAIAKEKWAELRERYHAKRLETKRQEEIDQIMRDLEQQTHCDNWLAPTQKTPADSPQIDYGPILDIAPSDYLALLDWTGRQVRLEKDKRGTIPSNLEPILVRMEIETTAWVDTVEKFDHLFYRIAGRFKSMIKAAKEQGANWFRGQRAAKEVFG